VVVQDRDGTGRARGPARTAVAPATMARMRAVVQSVNVGVPVQIGVRRGRPVRSAIAKAPVAGPVTAGPTGLDGDGQADLRVHGGPDKAVYAYAAEDVAWWAQELDREDLGPGALGENLTTAGIDLAAARLGDRWSVGGTLLEVCQPRIPCFKLGLRFGDPGMVRRFAHARRPGAYLRVLEPGAVRAGDRIELVARGAHELTIAAAFELLAHDRERCAELLAWPGLPVQLRDAIARLAA